MATEFDEYITREHDHMPEDYQTLARETMTHYHGSRCLKPGQTRTTEQPCKLYFPVEVVAVTHLTEAGFLEIRTEPEHTMRVTIDRKGFARLVAHCNAIGVGGARKIKYVIKYENKRDNLAARHADGTLDPLRREQDFNEIKQLELAQVLSASEAAFFLYGGKNFEFLLQGGAWLNIEISLRHLCAENADRLGIELPDHNARGQQVAADPAGQPELPNVNVPEDILPAAPGHDRPIRAMSRSTRHGLSHWLDRPALYHDWGLEKFLLETYVSSNVRLARCYYEEFEECPPELEGDVCTGWVYPLAWAQAQEYRNPGAGFAQGQTVLQRRCPARDVVHIYGSSANDAFYVWLAGLHTITRADMDEALLDPDAAMERWAYPGHVAKMVFVNFLHEMHDIDPAGNPLRIFVRYWPNFATVARREAWYWLRSECNFQDATIVRALEEAGIRDIRRVMPNVPVTVRPFASAQEEAEYYIANRLHEYQQDRLRSVTELERLWHGDFGDGGLTDGQRHAFEQIVDEELHEDYDLAVIDEEAGSGKAWVLRCLQLYHETRDEIVLLWGSSGQAAVIINGDTIHCGAALDFHADLHEEPDVELCVLVGAATTVCIDEWAGAGEWWLHQAERRVILETQNLRAVRGLPPLNPVPRWAGKKVRLFGDTFQLPAVIRPLSMVEALATHRAAPAPRYLDTIAYRTVHIENDVNPRYLDADYSDEMSAVRRGTISEIDLTTFNRVGTDDDVDYTYRWLYDDVRANGLERANDIEIVVGKHTERARVLHVLEEALHDRGVPIESRTYDPVTLNETNPLLFGFDEVGGRQHIRADLRPGYYVAFKTSFVAL